MVLFKKRDEFTAGEVIFVEDNPLAYVGIYNVLRLQILSGEYQKGEKLPSRAILSEMFHASGKTIRRVVQMLGEEGLIERREKAAPLIIYDPAQEPDYKNYLNAAWLAEHAQQKDICKVRDYMDCSALIGAAVVQRALAVCVEENNVRLFDELDAIVDEMSPDEQVTGRFWRSSTLFWKRLIAQLNNAFIMSTLVRLGYFYIAPRPNTQASRQAYLHKLKGIVQKLRQGSSVIDTANFAFSVHYLQGRDFMGQALLYPLKPSYFDEPEDIEVYLAQKERYTKRIYLDLLSHVYKKDYQAGDFLPNHGELCQYYGVSHKTTTQAVKVLQELGIVKSLRGHGIQMQISSQALREQKIELAEMIKRQRRVLDQLQLTAITIEPVIQYGLSPISAEEAQQIYQRILLSSQTKCIDQPDSLLACICAHIRYPILKMLYNNVMHDIAVGSMLDYRKRITAELTVLNQVALDAAAYLCQGQQAAFGQKMGQLMEMAYGQMKENIKQAGYEEQVAAVYTQESLYQGEPFMD